MAIIKHPLATEKGISIIEKENKIAFVVDNKANKTEIKQAIEKLLGTKVLAVNTHNCADGKKRAYVTFGVPAIDVATRLGLM